MHFFNPAPVQKLVEVIRTVVTEPDVLDDVKALVAPARQEPRVCGDRAGFIANALLFGYLNHAVSMYEGRYASREDIDAAMRLGCGYPMGPLALLDLIGLDTAYEILDTMYKQGRDRLHAPAPILKQMVTAGLLGRKTGRGFYTYEGPDSPVVVADAQTPDAPTTRPQLRAADRDGRRRRLRHDGHRHRRGLRQGRVRRHCTSPAATTRSPRSAPRSSARWTRRSSAASSRRPTATPALAPHHRHDAARRPGRPPTWSSRRSSRTSRSSTRCSRTSTRSASPARSWPPRRRSLPVIDVRDGDQRGRTT